ncbi:MULTISPECIES: IclR family transcriptional regulator [unclassified Brenneria]|uniref:IclR family transcriptional regulator n=1 Tax=unclassified Brenneria TaxID=2634434 RepID=UPI001557520D|nr:MULTISPECIES: IclR family transcriptional regulator [unclassified Brenneria]MBJ7221448.1 IclR family transcriptional regulator [Brenneria sp. L3-3C-1]MEE3642691.1 IclR family transcriptional regulator [Brenneria sp. L3_3C_1]MEE3652604.1 IclR family transcriptional regulator [Brenneria sp. HEZEL_4_2_4]NPD02561.1 IclR family transcriptional regulator [Brenneria sp. hezel4-2-4]
MPKVSYAVANQAEEIITAQERVLMILKTIAQFGRPASATELMKMTGLAKSTLYRQLAILRRWGFVMEIGSLYAPGPVSLQLAMGFDETALLTQYAQEDMRWLSDASQETVAITVAINRQAVCVSMIEATQSLRCSFEKGRSVPLRAGATAKCLLAHLAEAELRHILPLEFPHPEQRAAVAQQLQAIREQGYAYSDSEVDAGIWGVSFPLLTPNRKLLGALSLMAPSQRVAGKQADLIGMTAAAVARIHQHLKDF